MANENVPAPAPTRSDDQMLSFAAWLDEDWFRLDVNLLREAVKITPVDQDHQFVSPPLGDAIMDFVNQLGYLREIYFLQEWRIAAEKEDGKKKTTPKAYKPIKPAPAKQAKPAIAKQPKLKPVKEKPTKFTPLQKAKKGKVQGQAHVGGVAIQELVAKVTRPVLVVKGKGKAIATEEQATQSLLAMHMPKRRNAKTGADMNKVISKSDTDILNIDEEQGEDVDKQSHVALTGPNPEPMHDDFVATIYPKVHESLKFSVDKQVILEDPPSSSGTLSSMKNLDDTDTFGDQLFNDKSIEYEPGKQNVDAKVVSMVTVPIHQASTSVPPLTIIDLSPPKPVASPLLESFTAATTKTTITILPLPLPP
nr:hypothetical protein [Tanacetum cinerariifolium]